MPHQGTPHSISTNYCKITTELQLTLKKAMITAYPTKIVFILQIKTITGLKNFLKATGHRVSLNFNANYKICCIPGDLTKVEQGKK